MRAATTRSTRSTRRTRASLRDVVDLARRAPSVHNTQPWTWVRTGEHRLELWRDPNRQLRSSDPEGRNLTISCGAALHHLLVVGRALGWAASSNHLPDPTEEDLLARVDLWRAPVPADADDVLEAVATRCTDRRRFTSWPVPEERIDALLAIARTWGAEATSITRTVDRWRVELLDGRAAQVQRQDARLDAEERAWIDRGPDDGMPRPALRHDDAGRPGGHRARFDEREPGPVTLGQRLAESTDGLLVISTDFDGPLSWLHAGAALSALWLEATRGRLSVVPLTQVIEVEECRRALQHEVLADAGEPQILVRIGWQEIARTDLPPTPRRSLADVLREPAGTSLGTKVPRAAGPPPVPPETPAP